MSNASLVMLSFFQIQNTLKFSHWRTKSYAEHKALDDFMSKFLDNMDKFIEIWQGKYGRIDIKGKSADLKVYKVNKGELVKYLDILIGFFGGNNASGCGRYKITGKKNYCGITLLDIVKNTDTDLLNIRDEIVGNINQLKYLLTLS